MTQQLRLCHQTAVIAPVVIEVQLATVSEVFVVVADTLANTSQHHTARLRKQHLQQDVGAVVGEIEAPTAFYVVWTKVHPPPVDDQQELQGIDQTGLACIVRSHQRYRRIQRQLCALVASTVKQHQPLKSIIHHAGSSSSLVSMASLTSTPSSSSPSCSPASFTK